MSEQEIIIPRRTNCGISKLPRLVVDTVTEDVQQEEIIVAVSGWSVFRPILWLWLGAGFCNFMAGLLS